MHLSKARRCLDKLDVYIDGDDIVRVKNRVKYATLACGPQRDLIILPSKHHQNHETVINEIRQTYFIVKLRVIYKIVRRNKKLMQQNQLHPKWHIFHQHVSVLFKDPSHLSGYNSTNFRGADRFLKVELAKIKFNDVQTEMAHQGILCEFNPPAAPHMGGAWERLVRSVKTFCTKYLQHKNFLMKALEVP
ncbi:hypothetical protein CVS40_9997 [Lucilia cuprina]|nr:hypothetical protein CVS40_9997 [Lucilia cuprina]